MNEFELKRGGGLVAPSGGKAPPHGGQLRGGAIRAVPGSHSLRRWASHVGAGGDSAALQGGQRHPCTGTLPQRVNRGGAAVSLANLHSGQSKTCLVNLT